MTEVKTSEETGLQWAKVATLLSVVVALTLAVAKAVVWYRSGSVAILGSLADSILDLAASVIAFIGVRMAAIPADHNHRFGHHKAEAISSLVQLVLISGSALFVLIESIRRVFAPEPIAAAGEAIGVMVLSIGLTTLLVAVQTIAIKRSRSLATEADRAHYLGDFLANAGALLAIVLATRFGLLWADGVAGLVAAGFLVWSVWVIAQRALPQLMDEELGPEDRAAIVAMIMEDSDVLGVHALRTRKAGPTEFIQLHIELDPEMPLRQVHVISDRVEARLHAAYPDADIMMHQDPHGYVEAHDEFGQPDRKNASVTDTEQAVG
mgnify:CR=1 FL=1